jgi:hypothetical protein
MLRRTLAPVVLGLLALSIAPGARALRAARPFRLELLAPLPSPFPPDGALVVAPLEAPRRGNAEPRAVRITGPDGARVAARVEELAPDLYRIVPARRLARGRHTVRGIGGGPVAFTVGAATGAAPAAPSIRSVVRTRRSAGEGDAVVQLERVDVALGASAPGVLAIFARWLDWHDSEGGLYGAWTTPRDAATFPLTCSAELECGSVHGHIPRPRERGELRAVDAAGRVSEPTPPFVVE